MDNEIVYVTTTMAVYLDGVKVWDYRWYVNIICRLRWLFRFRMKKGIKWTDVVKKPYDELHVKIKKEI